MTILFVESVVALYPPLPPYPPKYGGISSGCESRAEEPTSDPRRTNKPGGHKADPKTAKQWRIPGAGNATDPQRFTTSAVAAFGPPLPE